MDLRILQNQDSIDLAPDPEETAHHTWVEVEMMDHQGFKIKAPRKSGISGEFLF